MIAWPCQRARPPCSGRWRCAPRLGAPRASASQSTAAFSNSPSGGQFVDAGFGINLVSGDARDGTYQATVTVPAFSEQGTWTVEYLLLVDKATNTAWVKGADLAAAGHPTTFEVVRTG